MTSSAMILTRTLVAAGPGGGSVWSMSRLFSSLTASFTAPESRYQPFGTSPSNPELPKKPLNAWGFFVKSELTGISVGGRNDVHIAMKGLSPKWKAMTEAEKAPYVSQQNKALDEYNKAIARIDPKVLTALNEARATAVKGKKVTKAKTNVNKVVKESGMPRPPATAYMMYANEVNKSGRFSHMTVIERAKTVGALWKNMSQSEKEVWNTKSAAARKSYTAELAKWEQSNPDKVKAIEEAKANMKAAVKATKPPAPKPAAKKNKAKKVAAKIKT